MNFASPKGTRSRVPLGLPLALAFVAWMASAPFARGQGPGLSAEALAGESYVRATLEGGLSPFASVRYEVFRHAGPAVALHVRRLTGSDEPLQQSALLSDADLAALWGGLVSDGLFALAGRPRSAWPDGRRLRLEARWGDRRVAVTLEGLDGVDDPRYRTVFERLRRVCVERAGDVPFRNVFVDPARRGYLSLMTDPVADVHLDGRPTGEHTPLFAYELTAGDHEVRLVNRARGIDRRYPFRIEPGSLTLLNLQLR